MYRQTMMRRGINNTFRNKKPSQNLKSEPLYKHKVVRIREQSKFRVKHGHVLSEFESSSSFES